MNTEDAEDWLPLLDNAGSIFLGRWTLQRFRAPERRLLSLTCSVCLQLCPGAPHREH